MKKLHSFVAKLQAKPHGQYLDEYRGYATCGRASLRRSKATKGKQSTIWLSVGLYIGSKNLVYVNLFDDELIKKFVARYPGIKPGLKNNPKPFRLKFYVELEQVASSNNDTSNVTHRLGLNKLDPVLRVIG